MVGQCEVATSRSDKVTVLGGRVLADGWWYVQGSNVCVVKAGRFTELTLLEDSPMVPIYSVVHRAEQWQVKGVCLLRVLGEARGTRGSNHNNGKPEEGRTPARLCQDLRLCDGDDFGTASLENGKW